MIPSNFRGWPAARAALGRLVSGGFHERALERWFGVPLWTDVRYVHTPPASERPRRGLGGWIALLVAGESVEEAALGVLDEAARAALVEAQLVERAGDRLRARVALWPLDGLLLASDRLDAGADAVGAPDLSALNLAASLPARTGGAALDVGCGAGVAALLASRAGARAIGSDVDARALDFARLNALINDRDARFVEADLLGAAAGERFALVTFNAPLLRAPLASSDPHAPARYTQSPRGEALALEFLDGLAGVLAPGGEALLHAQLTPAVERALDDWAARAEVVSLRFATALDGTPHALTSIRASGGARGRRSPSVPLGPLCPHLRREILDAHHGARALAPDATPLAAPWLELRVSRQLAAEGAPAWRAATFGGVPVDDATIALLERLRGGALADLALDGDDRARLEELVARGLVILR
ncbi:MAG TPA: methyltransferase [Polyangia bacterium]|nr:methyltransferase [Polyangia bacterium]